MKFMPLDVKRIFAQIKNREKYKELPEFCEIVTIDYEGKIISVRTPDPEILNILRFDEINFVYKLTLLEETYGIAPNGKPNY